MPDLKVNTDAVVSAAEHIAQFNKQIKEGISSAQTSMNRLDSEWDGSAAVYAMSKFNEMKNKYSDARYSVLDNYVRFMLEQVGVGYERIEDTNTSLSEQFK